VHADARHDSGTHGVLGRDGIVPVRQRLVWKSLLAALPSVTGPQGRVRVLDCGGGSGRIAVPLAGVGAIVTVVDTSADALATLRRRAEEAGVADDVHPVQGDVEGLANLVAPASFDLVLAHGILEAVDGIGPVFAAMAGVVRPGGLLSVLTVNPAATVLSRALAGDLVGALRDARLLVAHAQAPAGDISRLCASAGLRIESQHGVGVFAELVPGAALDAPGAADSLAELEATVAGRAPFADIAGRIHTLARRPD
jgi:2-polyprenyl-3-methyl-5-hydroxy-6-metoxy-1,4-benzoquinol methylase